MIECFVDVVVILGLWQAHQTRIVLVFGGASFTCGGAALLSQGKGEEGAMAGNHWRKTNANDSHNIDYSFFVWNRQKLRIIQQLNDMQLLKNIKISQRPGFSVYMLNFFMQFPPWQGLQRLWRFVIEMLAAFDTF